jgi:hypothetical protein
MSPEREEALEVLDAIRVSDHASVRIDRERWERLAPDLTSFGVFYDDRLEIAIEGP